MEHGKPFEMQSYYGSSQQSLVKPLEIATNAVHSERDPEESPRTWKDNLKSSMDRFWLLEVISLFISFGSLAAIASLLMAYDNKPLPQWSSSGTIRIKDRPIRDYSVSVTLNSILSLIATVYKISLGIPVAASLGQLKWIWFADGHKLADFQMFDSAKGVLGSLLLLWNMRGRRLACLAAVVTLGSLALDFTFQSMVTYPITRVPSSFRPGASVPIATYYTNFVSESSGGAMLGVTATGVDQPMLGDIYTGIFNYNGSSFVSPSCPTGDCSWDSSSLPITPGSAPKTTSYASLGVCGKCQDSTASLLKSCGTMSAPTMASTEDNMSIINITSPYCNYTLPNGLSVAGNSLYPYLPLINASGETNRFENGTESVDAWDGDLSASYLKNATSTECALYYCVRMYSATVVNGTFKETILDTYQNDTVSNGPSIETWYNGNWYNGFDNVTLTTPTNWKLDVKAARVYNVSHYGWQGTYQQFQKTWSGNVTEQSTSALNTHKDYSSDTLQTLFGLNNTGLQQTVENLAHSMTNNIRQSSGQTSQGIAYQSIPYVIVAWGWISLPTFLLMMAFVLLSSTIFRTKRNGTQLWKASSLAAFYHPLTETGRERVGGARDNRHLEKIAEDIHVKWAKTEKGWRFIPVDGAEDCRKVD